MKKLLSFFITLIIIITPCTVAFGATYDVDQKVYAGAYMLISLDDSTYPVVAQKNQNKKMYPASLTKIVTAIVTLNNVKDLSKTTKVSESAFNSLLGTGAQTAMLKIGDKVTIEELLYLTMVYSACDACAVLAEYVAGSIDDFVVMMNDYAKSVGCKNTNFVNPTGLHDDNHYTTASDLSLITLDAMKSDEFMKISTTTKYEFNGNTFPTTNLMTNSAYLSYYYEYASGIKTGSTEEAGYCLISTASKDGYNYLAIVMDCPVIDYNNDGYVEKCSFIDSRTLFEWAFTSLKYKTVIKANEVVAEIPVNDGKDADTVQLVAKKDISTLVPASLDISTVTVEVSEETAKEVSAPIKKGDAIGKANIIYGDSTIGTVDLVAAKSIELSGMLVLVNAVKSFFSSTIVKVVLIAIVLCFIAYIFMIIEQNNRKKKKCLERKENDENK